ncbi:MAG: hypothetical protein IPN90_03205 [Elusimicrobia bacterium]|nr:hypothetical protein [Elusimicrobiota bacterium]
MTERILVRAPNWLGDAVMATPFLKRLSAKSPGITIDVLAKPGLVEIFQGAPGVSEVLPLKSSEGPWSLARRLRPRAYQTAYILPPSFSSALSCWLAGIPKRIGYAVDFRSPLLTEARPLDERFHYVRRYLGFLDEAGTDITAKDLFVPRANEVETNTFLGTRRMFGQGKVLAVAPGSRAPARRWFPDRFAEVINGLGPEWSTVLLLGAPEDQLFADEVARLSLPRRSILRPNHGPLGGIDPGAIHGSFDQRVRPHARGLGRRHSPHRSGRPFQPPPHIALWPPGPGLTNP